MDDLNCFVPSILHARSERKCPSNSANLSFDKKKPLSLRKDSLSTSTSERLPTFRTTLQYPSSGQMDTSRLSKALAEGGETQHGLLPQKSIKIILLASPVSIQSTRQPLQTLPNNIIHTKCTENFKFIKAVDNLNDYHRTLLNSVENPTSPMSSKKKKSLSVLKNPTPKRLVKPKNTLLNYFGTNSQRNDSLDPEFKNKIEEMQLRHKVKSEPLNTTLPIFDLCDDENSDMDDSLTNTSDLEKSALKKNIKKLCQESPAVDKSHPNLRSRNIVPQVKKINALDKQLSLVFSGPKGRPKKKCPYFKIVRDTPFAVDAFSYGEIPNISVYFLTHFHSDHYVGLNKSFNKPIYCTKITGDLCQQKLYVKLNIINILEVGKTVDIGGIKVTTVDANHCPGSVMLVFSLPCGRNILHCGDFRATPLMESYPVFWNKEIHTVYLDTTYCNPRFKFPTQNESINQALSILKLKQQKMIEAGIAFSKLLIVSGTYTIGKENFFMGIANELKIDVWASTEKNRILKVALGQSFANKPAQSCQLHVLPMGQLHYRFLNDYLKNMGSQFTEIMAFKPTGWVSPKGSVMQKENVTIHGIPYSEHSSFSELQRFTKFLKPKLIIPTVPGSKGCEAFQKYFSCWVGDGDPESQKKVSDYFEVGIK